MRQTLLAAVLALCLGLYGAAASAQQGGAVGVGNFIGLPIIGDDDSRVADVTDVLISYDGQIIAFIAGLSGRDQEGKHVRVPWSDVAVQQDPLQVKLTGGGGEFAPYLGPPAGTLGDINAALASLLIGAPAKTTLGERVGEVVSISATNEGRIIGATISQGDTRMPLPWSFVEIRSERPVTAVARDVEPVVVVDRRD